MGLLPQGQAFAHPVAYEGAIGLMAYHQPDMIDWQGTYSLTSRLALGVDYWRDTMVGVERRYLVPRVNFLLKRWNETDSQANVYLSAGAGIQDVGGRRKEAFLGAVEADYETRHIYFSGRVNSLFGGGEPENTYYQLRAGFAPYVGKFDGLNTWVILQGQYFPRATAEAVRVGPVLRFFYENVLWEMGVSARGTWSFNFMTHF